ncbi:MAG TPA: STAS/SEC14 domain-containing protein [Gammaproteobacteria bacterium]|jgi:hypothetical protein|nr:STAS/SEC14 domain-containing protein [Gammaproteobacteria bacterium]
MPVNVTVEAGQPVVLTVTGKLSRAEHQQAQQAVEAEIARAGDISILVLLENFTGWEKGADWGDFSFLAKNDPQISRMAIVGDPQWEASAEAFTLKGLRKVEIEYFGAGDEKKASDWLMSVV